MENTNTENASEARELVRQIIDRINDRGIASPLDFKLLDKINDLRLVLEKLAKEGYFIDIRIGHDDISFRRV